MIFLKEHQFLLIAILIAVFTFALFFNKKLLALSASLLCLFLGAWMFVAGFTAVTGWEGMSVTIAGMIYFAGGLITVVVLCLWIHYKTIKDFK